MNERLRRSKGRAGRRTVASTKVTLEEHKELEAAAKMEGKVLSEWAREVLLEKARRGPNGAALFTELIGLRLFVHSSLRSLLQGKQMSDAEFTRLQAEVKSSKHAVAGDVLDQYRNREGGN